MPGCSLSTDTDIPTPAPAPAAHVGPDSQATTLGLVALLLWSTSIACSGSVSHALGGLTAGAIVYLLAGVIALLVWVGRGRSWRELVALPPRYLLICGFFFVFYNCGLYWALGATTDKRQIIEVGIVNYLWPSLTLVLAVPIQKQAARLWLLLPGAVIAFLGVALAKAPAGELALSTWLANMGEHPAPYLIMAVSALSWALYSNLARRLAGPRAEGGMPLFLLANGVVLVLMRLGCSETSHWSLRPILEVSYQATVTTFLASTFWETAMRRGNLALVAAASYATPLLSTFVSCLYLGEPMTWQLWAGCVLVVGGACVCRLSLRKAEAWARTNTEQH